MKKVSFLYFLCLFKKLRKINSFILSLRFDKKNNFIHLKKGTILGEPNEIMHLGRTELNQEDFFEVIRQMSEKTYK